jgi:hypothetical protein
MLIYSTHGMYIYSTQLTDNVNSSKKVTIYTVEYFSTTLFNYSTVFLRKSKESMGMAQNT